MKFTLSILIVVVTFNLLNAYEIPVTNSGVLAKKLQKFLDLIPLDQIIEVTKSYYAQDNKFRKDEYLDIYCLFNKFNESLEFPSFVTGIETLLVRSQMKSKVI